MHRWFVLLLILLGTSARATPDAGEHLLAGARHFRDGRFAEALVEFRTAEKRGQGGEAAWYAAACLVKLNRPEDAVEAFAEAARRAPGFQDEIVDYYRAIACSEARLYFCADRLLNGVRLRAGPRIREEAGKLHAGIQRAIAVEASKGTIDWYHQRAEKASGRGRAALAQAYLDEAVAFSLRRKDRYRVEDMSIARPKKPLDSAKGVRK